MVVTGGKRRAQQAAASCLGSFQPLRADQLAGSGLSWAGGGAPGSVSPPTVEHNGYTYLPLGYITINVPVVYMGRDVWISGPAPSNAPRNGFPLSQIHTSSPILSTGTLVILWTRDKRETRDFRAHSEMVYNERVSSLRGRIKGLEGWEGGELEGENKRGGGGGGGVWGQEQVRYESQCTCSCPQEVHYD